MALQKTIPPIATDVTVAWSVKLVHPTKAVGRNELPFGRRLVWSQEDRAPVATGREIWGRKPQFAAMPPTI